MESIPSKEDRLCMCVAEWSGAKNIDSKDIIWTYENGEWVGVDKQTGEIYKYKLKK